MSWLAISDGRRCLRAPQTSDPLLTVGSLLIEFTPPDDPAQRSEVLSFERRSDWLCRLKICLTSSGLTVEHQQGNSFFAASVPIPHVTAFEALRITFSWDGPNRIASLTAENPDTGAMETATFDQPHPIPVDVIAELVRGDQGRVHIAPSVSMIAASDRIEPVGPMPSILEGTPIETAAGIRAIETLRPGDLILTARGWLEPVRQVVTREVPALGRFRPICLRAPYLGLSEDLNLAPLHRVLVDGTDTEYLFGTETVLIEARHLGPMTAPVKNRTGGTVRYAQVVLDSHTCIRTAGAWTESLYTGRLARRSMRHGRSILAGVPAHILPVHPEIAGPLLKSYEAMVLVSSLCA